MQLVRFLNSTENNLIVRGLQALISNHSSLTNIEKNEDELYRKAFVPKTLGPFNRLRLGGCNFADRACSDLKIRLRPTPYAPRNPNSIWAEGSGSAKVCLAILYGC
jgi:hypothetical protein